MIQDQKLKHIKTTIKDDSKRLKRFRDLLVPMSFFSFVVNPLFSIPTLRTIRYLNKRIKDEEETDYKGEPLKPLGTGQGDYTNPRKITHRNGIYWGVGNDGLPVHSDDKDKSTHGVIFGRTGRGKTTTIFSMIQQQIIQSGGFIFIDGKSESPTWGKFFDLMKEIGRGDEMFLLSFRRSKKAESNTLNILNKGSSSQIGELLRTLRIRGDSNGDNRVFLNRRKQGIETYCGVVVYLRDYKKERVKMTDLEQMLKPERLKRMLSPSLEEVLNNEKLKPYRKYWVEEDYTEEGTQKTLKDVIRDYRRSFGVDRNGHVSKRGEKLFTEQLSFITMQFSQKFREMSQTYGHIFDRNTNDIDISDIIKNNRGLYILLPRLEKGSESRERLGKLSLRLIKLSCRLTLGNLTEGDRVIMEKETLRLRSKPPFVVIRDEYGSYRIKGFSDVLRQRRSLGVSIFISVQEKRSLEKRGREERKRILGNSVIKIFLYIEDLETREYRINIRGKTWVREETTIMDDKKDRNFDDYEERNNINKVEKNKIDFETLISSQNGRGYLINKNKIRLFQTPWVDPKSKTKSIRLPEVRKFQYVS